MLMDLLAEEPGVGRSLAEIARHLGVAKATCYPMVVALTESGWLIRHPSRKTYQLGPALIWIGRAAEAAVDVVDLARPAMHELADRTGLASIAFVPSGADLVVAEIVHPLGGRQGTLGLRQGDTVQIAPPLGAGLAAWYSADQLDEWFTLGAHGLVQDVASLRELYEPILALIRDRGYAVECLRQQQRSLADAVSSLRGRGSGAGRSTVALREARSLLSADVLIGAVAEHLTYQPISVNSVVFGPAGESVMVLCVVDAPHPISGAATLELGEHVRTAAARVTSAIRGEVRH